MAKRADSTESAAERTFEDAMERLEKLVERMEADKLPLEELLVRYEEGVKLVKLCSEKLSAAEKRIEIITRDAAGRAKAEPFDPASPSDSTKTAEAGEDVSLF